MRFKSLAGGLTGLAFLAALLPQGVLAASPDLGPRADGQSTEPAARLDQQAVHAGDLAGHDQRVDRFDGGDEIAQRGPLGRKRRSRSPQTCSIMVNRR